MMHIEACLRIRDKTITSFSGQGGIKGMASNREYLDFILEQLSGLANTAVPDGPQRHRSDDEHVHAPGSGGRT